MNLILEFLDSDGGLMVVICDVENKSYEIHGIQHHNEEPGETEIFYAIQAETDDEGMMMERIGAFTPKAISDDDPDQKHDMPAHVFISSLVTHNKMLDFIQVLDKQCQANHGVNFISYFDMDRKGKLN